MRIKFQILAFCALRLGCSLLLPMADAAADEPLSFNRDIRPILSSKCFACHGFDAKKRQADRRLDTAEGATADHDGMRAIVPGNLEKSELWRRVTTTDEDEMMPPPASNKKLTDGERDLLKRWIGEGAKYQKHWAFEPIVRPAVPSAEDGTRSVPTTYSPLDAFLNERMKQA